VARSHAHSGVVGGGVHPDFKLGFEIVARVPMDGSVAPDRGLLIEDFAEDGAFAVISVEDLIADRVGQWASGTARDRLDQGKVLLALHPDADRAYLDRRIREESKGEHGIEVLQG